MRKRSGGGDDGSGDGCSPRPKKKTKKKKNLIQLSRQMDEMIRSWGPPAQNC